MFKGLREEKRRGTALILYTVLLPTILLFCGLAIDLSMLYVVQSRLSSAVDGAALGAGRLLGTSANTTEIAGEFLTANYPTGFWGSYSLTPNISRTDTASLHTISISASVQVPLLFLRLLRQQNCSVSATATAVRRDVRVVLVLDRSYSMVSQMSTLRTASSNFVNMFNPGTDEMGLVVFGGSGFVAYPNPGSTPNANYTGGNGPDIHFADPVTAPADNLLTVISALQVGTDTNTSEGLWLAYLELKKAVAVDTDPTRANVIVLFTDGVPNGFTAYINDPSHNALSSSSNCYYNPATGSSNQQIGWIASSPTGSASGLAFFDPSASTGTGFYNPLIFNTAHSAKYWVKTKSGSYVDDMSQVSGTPMTNCRHLTDQDLSGLAKIPPQDYYGTSTNGTAYTQGVLYNQYHTTYDSTKPNNGYHEEIASWNAVDNAAQRILSDSSMNIAIYTIGFTGNGGVDPALLKRVANTQDSTSYNSNYQSGLYVEASDSQSLQQAFIQVASEVLRLTK
jgi:Flp pilus assembly protein TadG